MENRTITDNHKKSGLIDFHKERYIAEISRILRASRASFCYSLLHVLDQKKDTIQDCTNKHLI